jgi:RNA polymerase sigma factor (sigma-70 family)
MLISEEMSDVELDTKAVIEKFSLLVRQVIQKNLHRGDGVDLEDIEQEVRLKIWTFLRKGKKVDNLSSYIKKVAYSTTIDELRKMHKQRPGGQPESLRRVFSGTAQISGLIRDSSPEAGLEDEEAKETIFSLVNSLSENRRRVLKLYLTGMSIDEISEFLKLEKPNVRHLFYRAIDDLKQKSRIGNGREAGNYAIGLPRERNHETKKVPLERRVHPFLRGGGG